MTYSMNELMTKVWACRTALATPCLLITTSQVGNVCIPVFPGGAEEALPEAGRLQAGEAAGGGAALQCPAG